MKAGKTYELTPLSLPVLQPLLVIKARSGSPNSFLTQVLSFRERGSLGELQHGSEGLRADIGVPAGGHGNPESWGVSQALVSGHERSRQSTVVCRLFAIARQTQSRPMRF